METQNQNIRYLIIGVLALIIVGVIIAIIVLNNDSTEESTTAEPQPTSTEESTDTTTPTTSPQSDESQPTDQQPTPTNEPTDSSTTNTPTSQSPAQYTDYTTATFNQARQDNKNVVLFFHANWCPTCRALDREITDGLSRLPANTEILKIDYDNAGDLRREYSIRQQHTLVFLSGDPNQPAETLTGGDFDELIFLVEKNI